MNERFNSPPRLVSIFKTNLRMQAHLTLDSLEILFLLLPEVKEINWHGQLQLQVYCNSLFQRLYNTGIVGIAANRELIFITY